MAKDTYKKVPVIKELAEPEEEGADQGNKKKGKLILISVSKLYSMCTIFLDHIQEQISRTL